MPCPDTLETSRKRQKSEDHIDGNSRQLKRLKTSSHPPPEFWDNLSKIWLTKDALQELDRRNHSLNVEELQQHSSRPQHSHRPLTRRLQNTLKRRCQTPIPDPLNDCKPEVVREIKRLSRRGGPDLSDLRDYPYPHIPFYQSMSTKSSQGRKRPAEPPSESQVKTTTKTSTAYNRNFQQHLTQHGVYMKGYMYPDGRMPVKPNNWEHINEVLARSRRSLSPSQFSETDFQEFEQADTNAGEERPVTTSVIPTIEGKIKYRNCLGEDYLFSNLAPLTDGSLASAKPDRFYGARPEQLNSQILQELGDHLIPSTTGHRPVAPNFFLEAKGPDGSLNVVTRQACYNGALGARGIHSLQSYKQAEPIYDNNAYTITTTYHGGTLKLYTTHITAPQKSDGRPEYIMTQLNAWSMVGNIEGFRQGASAYRNARDWAKEQRDRHINAANERFQQAQSELPSASEHETTSGLAVDGSDTSAMSDEAEFHDAAWSFAQPNDSVDAPEASSRPAKRTRTQISGSKGLAN
ncbi:hypothetical protein MferCBS31731_000079 [Microsporum ferrugineum]